MVALAWSDAPLQRFLASHKGTTKLQGLLPSQLSSPLTLPLTTDSSQSIPPHVLHPYSLMPLIALFPTRSSHLLGRMAVFLCCPCNLDTQSSQIVALSRH